MPGKHPLFSAVSDTDSDNIDPGIAERVTDLSMAEGLSVSLSPVREIKRQNKHRHRPGIALRSEIPREHTGGAGGVGHAIFSHSPVGHKKSSGAASSSSL
ncbi:hypothetical protein GTPT_3354 [Tatumella ptyseos ATCC 33301]|uniref:Uncharacterized protein n=1 Tax=Tatumella ptyseos ATCC 33301 TaxID=1005995 RepID=A0A085J9D3_9GAMM|nr:hypothetical protein GTPT_3354 [Tatumella ptyseos ATCC 33301]